MNEQDRQRIRVALSYEALVKSFMDDYGLGEEEARAIIARTIAWLEAE